MNLAVQVVSVDIAQSSAEITELLRRSFAGVAEEMGLTHENCPHHVAFMTEERLLAQLRRKDARCFGIRIDSEWVGFVAVAPYHGDYEITRLAVAPGHRHKGYGRALVERACDAAREMGLSEISLGMIDENRLLKKWYEAQGFIPGEPFRPEGAPYTVCGMSRKL